MLRGSRERDDKHRRTDEDMRQGAYWNQMEDRLVDWVDRALRRKPSREAPVAGALMVTAASSSKVRKALLAAADRLVERRAFDRPLYGAAVRALADTGERRLAPLLVSAMDHEHGGGLSTIAATAYCRSSKVDDALARTAASRHPDIAFAAMLMHRLRSGAGEGRHLVGAAARLKESARIELCTKVFAPLVNGADELPELPATIAPAVKALRDAERHLGRWLILARVGVACGDQSPVKEVDERARSGSASAKAAWSLLGWALVPGRSVPPVRPTTEIVSRLSDRPTAERDMSFLFRLVDAGADTTQGLLESLSKPPLKESTSLRAASALAHHFSSSERLEALRRIADRKKGALHGIAVAGIHDGALDDGGVIREARDRAAVLCDARSLPAVVWGGLVMRSNGEPVIDEPSFRRLERGWVQ
jgi:hypothetical protein